MHAIRRRRSLRRGIALAEAIVALAFARLALRLLPFRWLVPAAVEPGNLPLDAGRGPGRLDPRSAAVAAAVAGAVARLPWHSTCLVRALAGRLMLARRGVSSVLCLGVAKDDDALRAHAWLVAEGVVICGGPEAPDYTIIAALPSVRSPRAQTR